MQTSLASVLFLLSLTVLKLYVYNDVYTATFIPNAACPFTSNKHFTGVGVIFHPHGRKFRLVINRYFLSMRTEIYEHIFAIFRPQGWKCTFINNYFPPGRLCIADLLVHSPDGET